MAPCHCEQHPSRLSAEEPYASTDKNAKHLFNKLALESRTRERKSYRVGKVDSVMADKSSGKGLPPLEDSLHALCLKFTSVGLV
ncbi:hypothetical protein BDA96_03G430200 [Sorghum bicolor]|uniref:Uncharacterized protein n=1 Tax=Sorghum bicolor TaxID=4558 RepID=A0A921URL0_SORBI|nr:hypothetical protein BDA96_03G430200 [Sorghum bicolor]